MPGRSNRVFVGPVAVIAFVMLAAIVLRVLPSKQSAHAQAPAAPAAPAAPGAPGVAAPPRVLIISVDGLRPDLPLRAKAPNIRRQMDNGSFTLWARTTDVAVTLPSHASMLTGEPPEKHGVNWNKEPEQPAFPNSPTLFDIAKKAGLTTGLAAGKRKFSMFNRPGSIDFLYLPAEDKVLDAVVTPQAVKIILEKKPRVMFVHLAEVDTVGHAKGWGTPEQLVAVEHADAAIGAVLDAARTAGTLDQTLVIITADHGGSGITHGANDMQSTFIPWIVTGPGVKANHDLSIYRDVTVRTEDTFATACTFLGLPLPAGIKGKPVMQVFKPTGTAGNTDAIEREKLVASMTAAPTNNDPEMTAAWETVNGDWKGCQVWGDNHAEFVQTNRGSSTRYLEASQTGDNIFVK